MISQIDTIAAIATPPGKGGVAIVRVSGPNVADIALRVCGKQPQPRLATFAVFRSQDAVVDEGIVIRFVAPHSFTGEDVLELQGHGGTVVVNAVLEAVLAAGARLARPGEFSERAFLNNKLDLVQAEAVADLIDAETTLAARSAVRSLQGAFSSKIHDLVTSLIRLRQFVEATIDFPDEDIEFIESSTVVQDLLQLQQQLLEIDRSAHQGVLLKEGMTVVITGKPNAGKSSLLNALACRDSAIVTAIPGTTRDVLREQIQIDGMPLHIVDTAGLRQAQDQVEQVGVERAHQALSSADLIVLLVDATEAVDQHFIQEVKNQYPDVPLLEVMNKADLLDKGVATSLKSDCVVSAKTGHGIDELKNQLKAVMGFTAGDHQFIARQRHLEALRSAANSIDHGLTQLKQHQTIELLAEDLRQAQLSLNRITGEFTSDDLLGEIFSHFCIGK